MVRSLPSSGPHFTVSTKDFGFFGWTCERGGGQRGHAVAGVQLDLGVQHGAGHEVERELWRCLGLSLLAREALAESLDLCVLDLAEERRHAPDAVTLWQAGRRE